MGPELNIQNSVLIGDDGEMFLGGGAHNILKFALGESTVNPTSVKNFWWNFRERTNFGERHGINFLQMVAPEKYKVYPESFPVEKPKSFWDSHAVSDLAVPGVWYGVDELRENPFGRSYYKSDTHWSQAGLMLATLKIAETAGFTQDEKDRLVDLMKAQSKPLDSPFSGDLGRKLDPPVVEEGVLWPTRAPSVTSFENGIGHIEGNPVNDGRLLASENPESVTEKAVLIFGDSYLFNALPYIELGFRKMVFCRTRFFHREIVNMIMPDTIISQAAERYTRMVSRDVKAPPFLLLPYVLGRNPEMTPKQAAFLSRMLSNKRQPDFSEFNVDLT